MPLTKRPAGQRGLHQIFFEQVLWAQDVLASDAVRVGVIIQSTLRAWERLPGVVTRLLDASLGSFAASRQLPHDVVVYSKEFVHLCFIITSSIRLLHRLEEIGY
jgi:hypothetical protein